MLCRDTLLHAPWGGLKGQSRAWGEKWGQDPMPPSSAGPAALQRPGEEGVQGKGRIQDSLEPRRTGHRNLQELRPSHQGYHLGSLWEEELHCPQAGGHGEGGEGQHPDCGGHISGHRAHVGPPGIGLGTCLVQLSMSQRLQAVTGEPFLPRRAWL